MKLSSLLALLFAHNQALIVQDIALAHANGDISDEEAVRELKSSKLKDLKSTGCPYLAEVLGIDLVVYSLPTASQLANTRLPVEEVSILRKGEVSFEEAYAEGDDQILEPYEI
ncbi:MAG: hypothetical protein VXZ72_05165 [Chlamydiota bacterium]|nr:hypothetical protein [Chlamydiota bacterium]